MAEGYLLTTADRTNLEEMLGWFRRFRGNDAKRPPLTVDDFSTGSDVYVVRTPAGGIPALDEGMLGTASDDVAGSAECSVYQLIRESGLLTLSQAVPATVWNLGTDPISGDTWVLAARDKFGAFWALSGTGGGGSDCYRKLSWLRDGECITISVYGATGLCVGNIAATDLNTSHSGGTWISYGTFRTPTGLGTFTFTTTAGGTLTLHTTGDASGTGTGTSLPVDITLVRLGCVGNGMLFLGGGEALCPGTPTACADNTFLVLVECTDCNAGDTGTGDAVGTGTGTTADPGTATGEPGSFPNCADVPTTLDWTSTGTPACLNGLSGSITRSGSGSPWSWGSGNNLTACGTDSGFSITCFDPAGAFTGLVDGGSGTVTTLIDQTTTSLTFQCVSDGSGPLAAGTSTFVVVIP